MSRADTFRSNESPGKDRQGISLWVTALTLGLLAAGFTRQRYADTRTRLGRKGSDRDTRGRGRNASRPSEIPIEGWKDILLRVYRNVPEHRVIALAAGVTFYALLALFPAVAALVALYGLFADPATISGRLDSIAGFLPGGAIDVIRDELTRVAQQGNSTLGVAFAIGLAVSLWSANSGLKALFDALNFVYGEKEKRSFLMLNAVSLAYTGGAIIFILLALAAIVILPTVLNAVGLAATSGTLVRVMRWPVLLLCIALALAFIYRFGPSRAKPRWRWITWGSAFAAVVWLASSILFSWYAENFGSFNKTYGSLGAVIGFMVWIWLSAVVILMGAELDAEMEHQTARDTTTGVPKPMGERRAVMADTLGATQA
jgi:membrane protein